MSQLKYYNEGTSQWEPVLVGATGPTGATGATGSYEPQIVTVSTTYTIQSSDANKIIYSTGASPYTITINDVLSPGQWVDVVQYNVGQITFAAGAGVTLNSSQSKNKTNVQFSMVTVICLASGIYVLGGDLA